MNKLEMVKYRLNQSVARLSLIEQEYSQGNATFDDLAEAQCEVANLEHEKEKLEQPSKESEKTFKEGEKFSIGSQDYEVVCEKANSENGLKQVVVKYRDLSSGLLEYYTFSKTRLIELLAP